MDSASPTYEELAARVAELEGEVAESQSREAYAVLENARLFNELQERNREISESLERQTAMAEVLEVIGRTPIDLQSVLDSIVAHAADLVDGHNSVIQLVEGEDMVLVSSVSEGGEMPPTWRLPSLQSPIPISDATDPAPFFETMRTGVPRQGWGGPERVAESVENPSAAEAFRMLEIGSTLWTPLRRGDQPLGLLITSRRSSEPFTQAQIDLHQTFADQAVVAIENARLFTELQGALERQTATSEVLEIISSAPTDLPRVLDALMLRAGQLCGAPFGGIWRVDGDTLLLQSTMADPNLTVAPESFSTPLSRRTPIVAALLERRSIHVYGSPGQIAEDWPEEAAFILATYGRRMDATIFATPLIREGEPIGVISIADARGGRPFPSEQIQLLETFADQAVIAIENARLFNELQERNREVSEALEQQRATSDVLSVISQSPTSIEPVLDAIIRSAQELCGAEFTNILRPVDGIWTGRSSGLPGQDYVLGSFGNPDAARGSVAGRAFIECRTVMVDDLAAELDEYPEARAGVEAYGYRTTLAIPLVRQGEAIGVLMAWRRRVQRFTPQQIDLLEAFADQAVIALENARLFNELQERNREVTEALAQQTATSQILEVISSSPSDVQPVLHSIVASAIRLCGADAANVFRLANGALVTMTSGPGTLFGREDERLLLPPTPDSVIGRAFTTGETAHVADLSTALDEFPEGRKVLERLDFKTILAIPLVQEGRSIGVLVLVKRTASPFADNQVALLETFADQAVIAIENARLFNELQERNREVSDALARETASAAVLSVIASSPTDPDHVLEAIARSAVRVLQGDDAGFYSFDGTNARVVATAFASEVSDEHRRLAFPSRTFGMLPGTLVEEVIRTGTMVRAFGGSGVLAKRYPVRAPNREQNGIGSFVGAPMLREGNVIGVLVIERRNPSDFPPEHLALLQTFADQAVIAIENARLFNELQERNREVTEALDQQTAMAEVLGIIASSAVDAQPVLDAIAVRAARLCGAGSAHVLLVRGDEAETVAVSAQGDASLGVRVPIANDIAVGRSILRKEAVAWTGGVSEFLRDWPRAAEIRDVAHFRDRGIDLTRWSFLVVPLVSGNAAVGAVMFFGGTPFSASETALARVFADQAVIAIENARLFNELQDRNRALAESVQREAALAAVSHRINEHPTDVDGTLQLLAETTRALTDSTSARVWLLDGDSVVSGPGATGDGAHLPPAGIRVPLSASAEVPRAITEGRTIVTDDAFLQNVVADALEYRQISQIRSVMATPLRSGSTYIGTLAAARTEVRPYNAEEVATLEAVAAQAATAIETARAQLALAQRNAEVSEALRRQEATSDILNHISRAPEDLEATLVAIAEVARKLCAAQSGDFWKLEGDRLIDHYSVEPGSFNGEFDGKPSLELPLQEALKTWPDTYARRASVLTEPALTDGPSSELSEIARVMSGHATARVSVYIGANWEGSLAVTREDPRPFSDAELALLESLADQGAIAIANARLLRELRDRTAELEVVSRHKSEFLANMSHELRTPLNAIIGYSELLQEECLDTGNQDFVPDLQKIHSAGRHLLTLISGILDVSKIEAGRMTMYLEDFDVPALIAETEELVRPLVEKNGNTFTVDCPVDAGMMHADLVKCRQVLFNLLSNAAKFTENGAVTLQVRRDDDEQTMSFAVRDTGIGISDEQRERLFETFAQAESNIQRKYGGTGLGLALSRQFCLMMGGDITVSSRPGHGSTFTATLPLSVSESPTGGETAAQTSQEPLRG